jgi:hypothetical protein
LLTGELEKNVLFSTHLSTKEPWIMPVEQFLASLRFENKAKLYDLWLEIDANIPESGD